MRKLLPLCLALGLITTAWAGVPGSLSSVNSHGAVLNGVSENATYNLGGTPEPATIGLTALGAFVLIRRR